MQTSQETSKFTLNYELWVLVGGCQPIFFNRLFQEPLVIIANYDLQQCKVTESGINTQVIFTMNLSANSNHLCKLPMIFTVIDMSAIFNWPFPSSLLPLFQNESKCETFHMKMSFTHKSIRM